MTQLPLAYTQRFTEQHGIGGAPQVHGTGGLRAARLSVIAELRLRAVLGAIAAALTVMHLTASGALASQFQTGEYAAHQPGHPISNTVGYIIIAGLVLAIAFTVWIVWWSIRSSKKDA